MAETHSDRPSAPHPPNQTNHINPTPLTPLHPQDGRGDPGLHGAARVPQLRRDGGAGPAPGDEPGGLALQEPGGYTHTYILFIICVLYMIVRIDDGGDGGTGPAPLQEPGA